MSRILLTVLFSVTLFSVISAVLFKDCGSKLAKLDNVNIPGCEKTDVCILKKNTNVTFMVEFTTGGKSVASAKAVVHGIIAGVAVPFPFEHSNACDNQGLTCPLAANTQMTYKTILAVLSEYPSVKVVVEWELKDADGTDIFCVQLPAQIES